MRPLILLIYANSKIPVGEHAGIGTSFDRVVSEFDHYFVDFCIEQDLAIPSTHPELHSGSRGTFSSGIHGASRIDFVCLPLALLPCVADSVVRDELDLLAGSPDHFLLETHVRWA